MSPEPNSLLPQWMLVTPGSLESRLAGSGPSRKKLSGFTEKTIYSIFHLFREELFSEQLSRKRGLLQKLDPRTKLLIGLSLLATLSLLHKILLIGLIYATLLILALMSQVGLRYFMKRVWLFVPLATGLLALPATLNWITPGHPLWVLHRFRQDFQFGPWSFPRTLAVSDDGLRFASLFISRVGVSVSVVVLLTLTTPWQRLLRALRVLGVPQFFVFVLGMTYRYIHLFLSLMLDLHFGKKSRTLRASRWSQDQKWVASRMGYLFKRSQNLGESVYNAMLARGFQGEPKILEELDWSRSDLLGIAIAISFCGVLLLLQKFLA